MPKKSKTIGEMDREWKERKKKMEERMKKLNTYHEGQGDDGIHLNKPPKK